MKYFITISLLISAAVLAWINFFAPNTDLGGNAITVTGTLSTLPPTWRTARLET